MDIVCALITELVHQIKSKKYSFLNKHVVITGGSSGLGLELAKEIALEKATVTIIARNKKSLQCAREQIATYSMENGLMDPQIFIEQAEIWDKDAISVAINNAVNKNGMVDIVFCNAGMAKTGYIQCYLLFIRYAFAQSINDYQQSIDVNYMGTVNTLFCSVPNMIVRNQVSSPQSQHCRGKSTSLGVHVV